MDTYRPHNAKNSMTRGIVYPAFGDKYIEEVKRSVDTLRNCNTNIPVTVFSDSYFEYPGIDEVRTIPDPRYDYGDSIISLSDINYDEVLQLDSDIYILENIEEIFDPLANFELGVTLNPGKRYYTKDDDTYVPSSVPFSFPLVNSGVMVYQNNDNVTKFLDYWKEIYINTLEHNQIGFNQPALREAIYHFDIDYFVLPREYNCHIIKPGTVTGRVKILHGRHPDIDVIADKINETEEPRCYHNSKYPIEITVGKSHKDASLKFKLIKSLKSGGIKPTIRKGIDKIR